MYDDLPPNLRDAACRSHRALHILWTQAVGTRRYKKQDWKSLDMAINDLIHLARPAETISPREPRPLE